MIAVPVAVGSGCPFALYAIQLIQLEAAIDVPGHCRQKLCRVVSDDPDRACG
jgi:hypothetical protein